MDGVGEGQLPAGQANRVGGGGRLDKLKAEAESVTLAYQSKNFYLADRQSEFEANDFTQWNFVTEHCGQPGLAQVDGISINYLGVAGVDLNIDFQRETGLLPGFPDVGGFVGLALIRIFQKGSPRPKLILIIGEEQG